MLGPFADRKRSFYFWKNPERRDVRCRAGLGRGWGRAIERPRLRFPPAAGKEEGAAVPVEGKFLGGLERSSGR